MKKYNKIDKLWAEAVRLIDGKCRVCGKTPIAAHHIFTRSRLSTRFDISNGISLCCLHHVFSSELSAHKSPREFNKWLERENGKEWLDALERESHTIKKWTEAELYELELHFKHFIEVLC